MSTDLTITVRIDIEEWKAAKDGWGAEMNDLRRDVEKEFEDVCDEIFAP